MSRPHLVHPGQPLAVRLLLHLYQFAASLKLAVVLILWLALTLAIGTFVEAAYGTPVAQYGVYQTFWFNLLLVLLATNIFCAATIRYPWKRYQTGFVITHIGLLTLLFGTALSRMYGIDAQIFLYEHSTDHWAIQDTMHFNLAVHRQTNKSDEEIRKMPRSAASESSKAENLPPVEFRPGPFSFRDYGRIFTLATPPGEQGSDQAVSIGQRARRLANGVCRYLSGWMFALARKEHAGDVLYDKDGVKLELLDYLADSRLVNAPAVTVAVSLPRRTRLGADGKPRKSRYHWMMQDLAIIKMPLGDGSDFPHGYSRKTMFAGGMVSFGMTNDPQRLKAFLDGGPQGDMGEKGQIVLFAGGKSTRFLVDDKIDAGRFPLAQKGWEAELTEYWPSGQLDVDEQTNRVLVRPARNTTGSDNPAVKITTYHDGKEAGRLLLFSDAPGDTIHDYKNSIYGEYWFNHSEKTISQRKGLGVGSRIDILQMHTPGDGEGKFQLYYRLFNREQLAAKGELPSQGSPETALDAFATGDQLKFYIHEHIPAADPEVTTIPEEFVRDKNLGQRRPAAKIRMTVDGKSEDVWLAAYLGGPDTLPAGRTENQVVAGEDRKVSIILPVDAVDIGFRVKLRNFEQKLDPGTSQASHYSSTVDLLPLHVDRAIYRAKLDSGRPAEVAIPSPPADQSPRSARSVAITGDGQTLYWTDDTTRSIDRMPLGGAKPTAVIKPSAHVPMEPIAIAVDEAGGHLIWIEYVAGRTQEMARLQRSDLDGDDKQDIATLGSRPTDIAIDVKAEKIYWSYRLPMSQRGEDSKGAIGRVDLDGENQEDQLILTSSVPSSLAVDSKGDWLYWTEPDKGSIRRAKSDGSQEERLTIRGDDQKPVDIAVDAGAGKIYWADHLDRQYDHEKATETVVRHRIWQANLDGSDAQAIFTDRIDHPAGLLVHDGQLWWTQDAKIRHDVWITMNAPIECSNPRNRHTYRLFQESFVGPWQPGSPEYERFVPKSSDADDLYMSILTVNYDPGRAIRNVGCLFVVLGIATMFYMRAYFFRPRRAGEPPAQESTEIPLNPASRNASTPVGASGG